MDIRRDCIPRQVRRTLTERILSGKYQPGERLVELQISKELKVSQGSVREALRELEASWLIESEPHRGARVRVISNQELREAYLLRGLLEEAAAPAAAIKLKGQAGPLRDIAESIVQAASDRELSTQAARNAEFHRRIVEASGNQVLLRVWDSLAFEVRTRVRLSSPGVDPVRDAGTHFAIVDALDAGDGLLAGRLLREHAETFAPPASE